MTTRRCPDCDGDGDDCQRCFGFGEIEVFRPNRSIQRTRKEVADGQLGIEEV